MKKSLNFKRVFLKFQEKEVEVRENKWKHTKKILGYPSTGQIKKVLGKILKITLTPKNESKAFCL